MNGLDNVYAFWTGFYDGNDCYEWASQKAYRDMCRTLTFRETADEKSPKDEKNRIEGQRESWRKAGTSIIKSNIINPPRDEYEEWHKFVCDELIKIYSNGKLEKKVGNKRTEQATQLTYGQAQKWLNMTLKYLWLLYRLDMINDESLKRFIGRYHKHFHVPLDSYILRYVARTKKQDKAFPDNKLKEKIKFKEAWSSINDYAWYAEYQHTLKESLVGYDFALEWELEHWQKALDYYDKTEEDNKEE